MSGGGLSSLLGQIGRAAQDACTFVEGFDKARFLGDKRTQQAVVMSLMIIGEAASRILDQHAEFARSQPEMAWRNMRGMRNRIAHGYFDIDLDVVWETVQTALPQLLSQLSRIEDGETGQS